MPREEWRDGRGDDGAASPGDHAGRGAAHPGRRHRPDRRRTGAEFLFQVIAERAEQAAVILTTNLPFSEWTQVITNARLCKALLDRITDRVHIIETGAESFRFRRTVEQRARKEGQRV